MAARSCRLHIRNDTDIYFKLDSFTLPHGIWIETGRVIMGDPTPRKASGPAATAISPSGGPDCELFSESDGFATGVEGKCVYVSNQVGTLTVYWSNPFAGSNQLTVQTPPSMKASWGSISGNDMDVNITLGLS